LAGAAVILLSARAQHRPAGQLAAALLLLLLITWLALASRNRRYFAVGWLWFLGRWCR